MSVCNNKFCLTSTSECLSGFFVDKLKFMTYKLCSDSCSTSKGLAVGGLVRGRGVCIWVFNNIVPKHTRLWQLDFEAL
ncbi:hypothetical protein T07_7305 [Trichinella nelsoni]|uniref:Uncharacterized protein n=1 Tax=Trichinella nelsoni TaxID=6336 RepID=A0A0V0RC45_9BILA|nr:hypothetical protein T07_7305 [Trichinella nelsoni]